MDGNQSHLAQLLPLKGIYQVRSFIWMGRRSRSCSLDELSLNNPLTMFPNLSQTNHSNLAKFNASFANSADPCVHVRRFIFSLIFWKISSYVSFYNALKWFEIGSCLCEK